MADSRFAAGRSEEHTSELQSPVHYSLSLHDALPILFPHFEAFFGMAPLPQGSTANLTVQMKNAMQPADPPPQLQPPANVAVETRGVRSPSDNQITWRIRALQPGDRKSTRLNSSHPSTTVFPYTTLFRSCFRILKPSSAWRLYRKDRRRT